MEDNGFDWMQIYWWLVVFSILWFVLFLAKYSIASSAPWLFAAIGWYAAFHESVKNYDDDEGACP